MIYNLPCISFASYLLLVVRKKNASEEDTEVFEESELPDFTPFVARFRSYKKDVSEVNKRTLMNEGMES